MNLMHGIVLQLGVYAKFNFFQYNSKTDTFKMILIS